MDVYSPVNLPGVLDVVRYEGYVDVGTVEPYAIKTFTIRKTEGQVPILPLGDTKEFVAKNEFFTLSVNQKGQVSLCWENQKAENCLYFEDVADIGDSYVFLRGNDAPIYSDEYVTSVDVKEYNSFKQSVAITYELPLPADYEYDQNRRSDKTEMTRVVSLM